MATIDRLSKEERDFYLGTRDGQDLSASTPYVAIVPKTGHPVSPYPSAEWIPCTWKNPVNEPGWVTVRLGPGWSSNGIVLTPGDWNVYGTISAVPEQPVVFIGTLEVV